MGISPYSDNNKNNPISLFSVPANTYLDYRVFSIVCGSVDLLREEPEMRLEKIHILLIGFLISFLIFYVYPCFLMSDSFLYFKTLPSYEHAIGIDLGHNISFSKLLLEGKPIYGNVNCYAPLVSVLFIPFTLVSFQTAFWIMTAITLCAFISLFVLAQKILGTGTSEVVLIFVSGLLSYGMAFQLERSQFYDLTMAILMWSLYLAYFTKYKKIAWGLFSLAVQMKLFPLAFIWLIAKRKWRDVIILGAINFGLLFVLGYSTFLGFINSLPMVAGGWINVMNHSLKSYFTVIDRPDLFSIFALLVIGGWFYVNKRSKGFDYLAIFYCSLISLLLPSVSYDYANPILILPMCLFVQKLSKLELFVVAILYSSMLFSYASKIIMVNNGLSLLLLSATTIWVIKKGGRNAIQGI